MSEETKPRPSTALVTGSDMMHDTARFEHSFRVAKVFSASTLVPAHLRGKEADIMIALHIADRLNEDPLTVMQSIYIVSGKAGWGASYMIARINRSGLIKGRLNWRVTGEGKALTVTAFATLADTGDVIEATVTMQMAMAEGWTSNKKYASMPELMLRYRSAAMLQRLYFPEVMLGMPAAEELEDAPQETPRDITPARSAASALYAFAGGQTLPESVGLNPLPESVVFKDVAPQVVEKEAAQELDHFDVIDDQTGELFDADDWLNHAHEALLSMRDQAEIDGAHVEAKALLKGNAQALGKWNTMRMLREKQLSKTNR